MVVPGMRDPGIPVGPPWVRGYGAVRVALAALLLVAAGLKAHQLCTEPVPSAGLFPSRWLLTAQLELQLLFGIWLLCGISRVLTWKLSVGCFAGFACVTLCRALSGAASCGCFGRVKTNLWYTLVLDLGAVGLLAVVRPQSGRAGEPERRWPRVVVGLCATFAVAIPAGLAMASYSPATLGGDCGIRGESRIVVLEPGKWVGKQFPLCEYTDIGDQFATGRWIVALSSHDCPVCRGTIPEYERIARDLGGRRQAPRVAFVEMPPYDPPPESSASPGAPYVLGRLSEAGKWVVDTPAVVFLRDGRVVGVRNWRRS